MSATSYSAHKVSYSNILKGNLVLVSMGAALQRACRCVLQTSVPLLTGIALQQAQKLPLAAKIITIVYKRLKFLFYQRKSVPYKRIFTRNF